MGGMPKWGAVDLVPNQALSSANLIFCFLYSLFRQFREAIAPASFVSDRDIKVIKGFTACNPVWEILGEV